MAPDYDEVLSDLEDAQNGSLHAFQSASTLGARRIAQELDEVDAMADTIASGWEFVAEELIVQIVPQAEDEFTCYSCFLVRHRSQIFRKTNGRAYCLECGG
ncbi:DUF4193 family protein [Arthrobacter sp. PM3]|uniref:DUF4193 family protein n=1 Tax=Arthrobacter sp. PM3 TaxID=2017685 RepID=UPI000E10AC1A|nr:DUF4193 family protein [Arthrobacter sp. PM3]AXJ08944.1 hypothetical protein CFN17_04390 [Arthrobacter sp. PM3]